MPESNELGKEGIYLSHWEVLAQDQLVTLLWVSRKGITSLQEHMVGKIPNLMRQEAGKENVRIGKIMELLSVPHNDVKLSHKILSH
jgi:hypothetical protein